MHHGREILHFNESLFLQIMFSEDLQHVPIEFHGLSTVRLVDGSLDKLLVLINASLINDGMRIQGGSLGSNMLPGELQPFVKGDDSSGFEVHGVEHFLSCCVFIGISFVQVRISWSVSVSSWHGGSSINQLGEGSLANETISVGVSINKNLEQGVIQLRVGIALLVLDGLLDEPDEVLLGLVEGIDSSGCGRHDEVPM